MQELNSVKIVSIRKIGMRKTYDLKVEDNNNFYLSNGILSHNSGSGKGTAFEFINSIARGLKNYDNEDIRFYSSGDDSAAVLLDKPEYDERRRAFTGSIRPGIVSSFDFICWEEAVSLLKPAGEYNEGKPRIILDATEPYGSPKNIHTKKLDSWPVATHTTSSATFIATTRPIENLRNDILYSGLFPRFMFFVRTLLYDDRIKMNEKSGMNSSATKEEIDYYKKEEKLLVKELRELQKFGKDTELEMMPREKVLKFICDKMRFMTEDCWRTVYGLENKRILDSFISRNRENMVKLAYHSAIMRKSRLVQICDVEYAFSLVFELYKSMKVWVELDINSSINKLYDERKRKIIQILKNFENIQRKELIQKVRTACNIGETTAYILVKRVIKDENLPIIEKNGLVEFSS